MEIDLTHATPWAYRRLLAVVSSVMLIIISYPAQAQVELKTITIQTSQNALSGLSSVDAVVEAVRQTTLSAQVAGAIVALNVKVGDHVHAGQVLLRIDGRGATDGLVASTAQAEASQAALQAADKELARQRELFQKQYISKAALERAQAQYDVAQAQAKASQAQAGIARTQAGYFLITAPYSAVVSDLPVNVGDMVMPGRPILTLFDPSALRLTASVPQSMKAKIGLNPVLQYELSEVTGLQKAVQVQWLPVVDASTHSVQVRISLPSSNQNVVPGMFAKVWLPASAGNAGRVAIPQTAVLRRSEMLGVYVLDASGRPLLRQVRLGQALGEQIEVLSGLSLGDKVVLDPAVAAKVH